MSKTGQAQKLHDKAAAIDAAAVEAVAPFRETVAGKALSAFSEIGDQPPMMAICGATIAAGLAGGNKRLALAGVRMLAAHFVATQAKNFVKQRVDRTRPRSRSGAHDHKPTKGRSKAKEETSFPSGHSAGAAAVAAAFARDYPQYRAAAYGVAGVVALTQIPRCAHYPSDVGVGVAIGVAAEAAVSVLLPSGDALG